MRLCWNKKLRLVWGAHAPSRAAVAALGNRTGARHRAKSHLHRCLTFPIGRILTLPPERGCVEDQPQQLEQK